MCIKPRHNLKFGVRQEIKKKSQQQTSSFARRPMYMKRGGTLLYQLCFLLFVLYQIFSTYVVITPINDSSKEMQQQQQQYQEEEEPSSSSTGQHQKITTVGIIGCGPGGMSFLHALEYRRRELEKNGDLEGIANLPKAVCFERQSSHGGVWRAKRTFESIEEIRSNKNANINNNNNINNNSSYNNVVDNYEDEDEMNSANMYEALWTNGAHEEIEYFDYTFDEHFNGQQLPVYLPRQSVLEYMTGRVTKHTPNFFDKYAKFNTSVMKVTYNETTLKFSFHTINHVTNKQETIMFDKCIWAAGGNGIPYMPTNIVKVFKDGNFSGRVIHSSDTRNFRQDVKDKNILLVGAAYSAEDLALTAIKLGVKHVYITHRSERETTVMLTKRWPMDKVSIFTSSIPFNITTGDSSDRRSSVQIQSTKRSFSKNQNMTIIHDIDTVVFCTGYTYDEDKLIDESVYVIPKDDVMKYSSSDSPERKGWNVHKKHDDGTISYTSYDMYRDLFAIWNPSMMYMFTEHYEFPLSGVEIHGWALLSHVLNRTKNIPTSKYEMLNDPRPMTSMNDYKFCINSPQSGGGCDMCRNNPLYEKRCKTKSIVYERRKLARLATDAHYPVDFGPYYNYTTDDLTMKFLEFSLIVLGHRMQVDKQQDYNNNNNNNNNNENTTTSGVFWKTFRDYDNGPQHVSVYTGNKACNSNTKWLDINEANMSTPTMLCDSNNEQVT